MSLGLSNGATWCYTNTAEMLSVENRFADEFWTRAVAYCMGWRLDQICGRLNILNLLLRGNTLEKMCARGRSKTTSPLCQGFPWIE